MSGPPAAFLQFQRACQVSEIPGKVYPFPYTELPTVMSEEESTGVAPLEEEEVRQGAEAGNFRRACERAPVGRIFRNMGHVLPTAAFEQQFIRLDPPPLAEDGPGTCIPARCRYLHAHPVVPPFHPLLSREERRDRWTLNQVKYVLDDAYKQVGIMSGWDFQGALSRGKETPLEAVIRQATFGPKIVTDVDKGGAVPGYNWSLQGDQALVIVQDVDASGAPRLNRMVVTQGGPPGFRLAWVEDRIVTASEANYRRFVGAVSTSMAHEEQLAMDEQVEDVVEEEPRQVEEVPPAERQDLKQRRRVGSRLQYLKGLAKSVRKRSGNKRVKKRPK